MAQDGPRWPREPRRVSVWYAPRPLAVPRRLTFLTSSTALTPCSFPITVHRAVLTFAPLPPSLGCPLSPLLCLGNTSSLFFKGCVQMSHAVKCAVPPVAVRIKRLSFTFPYLQEKINHLFIQSSIS